MTLQQAITSIKAGDKETGQQLLLEIVKADPNNEQAWLWMSQALTKTSEQRQCLERVLQINPNNQNAQKGLQILDQRKSSVIKPLDRPKPIQETPPVEAPQRADRQLIENEIARYTARGWQVISQTDTSVQLRKPRQWSQVGLILSALLFCGTFFFAYSLALAVVLFALTILDYLLKKDQIVFLTADAIRAGPVQVKKPTTERDDDPGFMGIVVIIGVITLILVLFYYIPRLF